MRTLILTALLLSFCAQAMADLNIEAGVGQAILDHNGTPFERMANVGYQIPFHTDFFVRPEAGYFMALAGDGKSSWWATTLVGIRALSKTGPELHVAIGPTYLATPDYQYLSGQLPVFA